MTTAPKIRLMAAAVVLFASGCATRSDPWICSDYRSTRNCIGGQYLPGGHHGIDFGVDAGTEVISATYGRVARLRTDKCVGYQIEVETDMVGRSGEVEGRVFAIYAHAKPIDGLAKSQEIKPGDPIAHVIPLLGTSCYGSREHVHYELRVKNDASLDIDPHQFWVDGPSKVTCFKAGAIIPPGKAVAPVQCQAKGS